MFKLTTIVVFVASLIGCGTEPGAGMPACDTLRAVNFISRCDADHARCGLKPTAPAGASATGCAMTIVAEPGGPEQVECVSTCD